MLIEFVSERTGRTVGSISVDNTTVVGTGYGQELLDQRVSPTKSARDVAREFATGWSNGSIYTNVTK